MLTFILLNKNNKKKRRFQIQCVRRHFRTICTRYIQNRKIGKANNLKEFGNNKTKNPKYDIQNQVMSPMPEGGVH
jgi:hypothetical protein